MPRRLGRALRALAVCALASASVGGVDRDEFLCEEAAQRLSDCCPGATFRDDYCVKGGCGGQPLALSSDESECIRHASCDELRGGICERALARNAVAPAEMASQPSVCP